MNISYNMDSIIIHNNEETTRVWLESEELMNIVKIKVMGKVCNVSFNEGEINYMFPIDEVFLIQ